MDITISWLRQLIGSQWNLTPAKLEEDFHRLGIEVDNHFPVVDFAGPIVIARVESFEELTGFKKSIRYCQVNIGDGKTHGIICGARNFSEGDTVVAALPGAILPGNFVISARKTYGKVSEGMLCSYGELGLADFGEDSDGIIIFPSDGEVGVPFVQAVGLDPEDHRYILEITPDRGYLLSARGIARDLAALSGVKYHDPVEVIEQIIPEKTTVPQDVAHIIINSSAKVKRFALIHVRGHDPKTQSPWWLKLRLANAGIKPINLPVDITNYVMLELGQPMHAYDGDIVGENWEIRHSRQGETFITLDNKTRIVDPEDIVIVDEDGIIGLAGVMGGQRGGISESTSSVIFEAAVWDPATVFRSSKRHKIPSEAARRYIRGVDSDLALVALWRAAYLLTEIAGGEITAQLTDQIIEVSNKGHYIHLPRTLASQIVGVEYTDDQIVSSLQLLGFAVEVHENDYVVSVPSWRTDITEPIDLVEEIVRINGFDDIVSQTPYAPPGNSLRSIRRPSITIARTAAANGLIEVPAGVFFSAQILDQWDVPLDDPRRKIMNLLNPLDIAKNSIVTTLLPSLIEIAQRNRSRGNKNLSIFSIGQVSFASSDPMIIISPLDRPDSQQLEHLEAAIPDQKLHFAALFTGLRIQPGVWEQGREVSYRDAIDIVQKILYALGIPSDIHAAHYPPFHPGRCAQFVVGNQMIGYAGQIHPSAAKASNLPENTSLVEITIDALPVSAVERISPTLSVYPAVLQDLAVIVDANVPANKLQEALIKGAGPLLESIRLYDVYSGKQLGESRKSLTYELVFRSMERTLTEDDASMARDNAVEEAYRQYGAIIRGPQFEEILASVDQKKPK